MSPAGLDEAGRDDRSMLAPPADLASVRSSPLVPDSSILLPSLMPPRPFVLAESNWKAVKDTPFEVAILPWGATEPMAWWTLINRARALENIAYVVAANQGASLKHYPPYSWPGGSQVVDYDGRVLAEASPGPGERIVVAPVDISALRHERASRTGHHMLAHLRTEAYPVYQRHQYPPSRTSDAAPPSYEQNVELIDEAKKRLIEWYQVRQTLMKNEFENKHK